MTETLENNDKILKAVYLANNVMNILDSWKLSGEEILKVLALPESIKIRHLGQYRKDKPFPELPEVTERIRHILGIANALRTSYPTNPNMGIFWLNQKTHKFKNQKPIPLIATGLLEEIITIRKHLDCSYDWYDDSN